MTFRLKYIKGEIKLYREILLSRLCQKADFAGYHTLLDYVERCRLYSVEGDVAEIGAFMGGGTRKLAKFFKRYAKTVIVVDVFDPTFDHTLNERGEAMSDIYQRILGNRDLRGIFNKKVAGLTNVIVHPIDSQQIFFNGTHKFCFSFIDGNHDPSYVKSDFEHLWKKTVRGGVVALHDYGGDLPQVTQAIDSLIREHEVEIDIGKIKKMPKQCLIFIPKKGE
jgi:hypothetical protein